MRIRKQWPDDAVLSEEEVVNTAKIADALAHPVRIRMLRYILTENLARQDVTNKDLVAMFDYAQATISQHVSKLLIGGLIEVKKKKTSSCYYACVGKLSAFMDSLKKIDTRGDTRELPDFLRAGFHDPDDAVFDFEDQDDELLPDFFDDILDERYDGSMRFL